jgi:Tfp pilus assembly protein PilX
MPKLTNREKGIAIFMVLGILLVVVVLANVILAIVSSNARFTHQQVSRIQAYYASQAGITYAIYQLWIGPNEGGWSFAPTNSCPKTNPCTIPDPDLSQTKIVFCASNDRCPNTDSPICQPPPGIDFCIDASTTYTYF